MEKSSDQPSEGDGKENRPLCGMDAFKKVFYRAAKNFYANGNKEFQVDECNKNFLGHFCRYWNQDPGFEVKENISLKKGLMVFGGYGTGKTTSFKIIQDLYKRYQVKELCFPAISAQEVVDRYNIAHNKEDVVQNYSKGVFLFDDLGTETVGNNCYQFGKEDIFVRILLNRYRNFESKGIKTHITTNLDLSGIEGRYGQQISDRFIRMFNLLKLEGPSRRK